MKETPTRRAEVETASRNTSQDTLGHVGRHVTDL